ncbi:MAG: hypothetical protein AB4063_17460 [Crocosphaera sp.]
MWKESPVTTQFNGGVCQEKGDLVVLQSLNLELAIADLYRGID